MNRLIIIAVLLLNFSRSFGQSEIEQRQIGKESFIQVSSETIIKLFDLSFEDWESLMVQLGYTKMDDSEGIITYSKGEIGGQTQAIAKNRIGLLSIDWFDFKDKIRLTQEIEKSLHSYFVEKTNDISYYNFNEYLIGLRVYEDSNYLRESVFIRQK
jgi:hypothetical protein